ncbi:MAG TPA: YolD-like family protein [Bacillota bacterium]|nr:YolD-like family protein [Bacillota bacterium]
MPKDRGAIKWTSLMLPEHVELLQQIWKDDKTEKPTLDPQQLEEMEYELHQAYQQKQPIQITVYTAGKKQSYKGVMTKWKKEKGTILLQSEDQKVEIPISSIIAAAADYDK